MATKILFKETEEQVQEKLILWFKYQYPGVLIKADTNAAVTLHSYKVKAKTKKLGQVAGWPDLTICKRTSHYAGLYVELKAPGVFPVNTKGRWSNAHMEAQAAIHLQLRLAGYHADFAVGFERAKRMIELYMKNHLFVNSEITSLQYPNR